MTTRKIRRTKKPGSRCGSDWTRPRIEVKPIDLASIPKVTAATTPEELLQIALAQASVRRAEEERYKEIRDNLRRTKREAAAARATQLSQATQEVPAVATPAVPTSTNPTNTTDEGH